MNRTIINAKSLASKVSLRIRYLAMLRHRSAKKKFEIIHRQNLWNSAESVSGAGSELGATKALREKLPELIDRYEIASICDAPCGDFGWMPHVLEARAVSYTGIDIVEDIIEANSRSVPAGELRSPTFRVGDIRNYPLPNVDLVIIRDCLFHLSFNDVSAVLQNLEKCNYRYLLTSTHTVDQNFGNSDIKTGDFRVIDLFSAPFSFPKDSVLEWIDDSQPNSKIEKKMVLLEKKNVPLS